MNRIAGIFSLDQSSVDHHTIENMVRAMDGASQGRPCVWVDRNVGLGCTRVEKTSGADNGTSPYLHPNERWVVNFDGRIDNRQELLAILRTQLFPGSARISDEEIVHAAYEKWRLDCPKHLIGDFAFAIWDRNTQTLICARDHFGVKPLYYSHSNTSFVFASTPQAVLASGKVPVEIQEERIADFLVNPL